MSKSLKDQFLKMGLTNDKKVKQAEKHIKKQTKITRTTGAVDETKLRAEQLRQEKAERDRVLNLQKKAEEEKKSGARASEAVDSDEPSDRLQRRCAAQLCI